MVTLSDGSSHRPHVCLLSGALPHRWVSVGQVATGFTYEEREKVCTHLQKAWVSSRSTPAPAHLVFNKTKPDYWILPEHSIALQVMCVVPLLTNSRIGHFCCIRLMLFSFQKLISFLLVVCRIFALFSVLGTFGRFTEKCYSPDFLVKMPNFLPKILIKNYII